MKQIFFLFFLTISVNVYCQEGKFIEANGVSIYYEVHGQGEPFILLHGNTMTHDMWTPWIDDLSQKYKVITVDLRGHGQSTNPTNEFSHKLYALDIYGLLDELNIDEFRAMGFSSGGMALIHMATMQTDRIQSLILIGATPYFPMESRDHMRKLTYEYVSEHNPGWMKYMKNVQPGGEAQIRKLLNVYVQCSDSYNDMNFTKPYLPQ